MFRHPVLQEMDRNMFLGKLFGHNRNNEVESEDQGSDGLDYELKREAGDDQGQSSDFEEWWGVEREGRGGPSQTDDKNDTDDDDLDGGEMMPVFDF